MPEVRQPARRETDTMDTFVRLVLVPVSATSSPHDQSAVRSREAASSWLPVDQYTGGVEHAVMHLLYSRFFTKAMRDMGLIDFGEPVHAPVQPGHDPGPDGRK